MIAHSVACISHWRGDFPNEYGRAADPGQESWHYTCTEDCVDQTGHTEPVHHDRKEENPMPEHDCADTFATLEVEPGQRVVLTLSADSPPILVRVRAVDPFPGQCPAIAPFFPQQPRCDLEVGHHGQHRAQRDDGGFWTWP